jgi:hypothetical protein
MNTIIFSLQHFEHFVLNHPKSTPIRCSAEKSVTLLVFLVFGAAVVRMGKIGSTFVVLVAFVCDAKVITISVDWPIVTIIINCFLFLSLNECHFFPEFELQQERTARRISDELIIIVPCPFLGGECGDGSVEFGADYGDGVWDIVAVSVECRSFKVVLRGTKQQLKLGGNAQLLQQIFIFFQSLRIFLQNFRINPQRQLNSLSLRCDLNQFDFHFF